ncbi:hypothetical protein [Nonomuraea roseoviolacea]|uniref:Uncharacterized protein n=1 Tax=Nonomuraea roseoviolacea subsp. carminata TaxID=160689 RepID=A0ABT1KAW2_9ACTN|nr:hypothetical protein [Nonomuraea roseoviolacea]MCP2351151.1 hypothetical protein [Nonomuraea roseoviolacea subsp. carminata]
MPGWSSPRTCGTGTHHRRDEERVARFTAELGDVLQARPAPR